MIQTKKDENLTWRNGDGKNNRDTRDIQVTKAARWGVRLDMENTKLESPCIAPRESDWSNICTVSQNKMTEKDREEGVILGQKEIMRGSVVLQKDHQQAAVATTV